MKDRILGVAELLWYSIFMNVVWAILARYTMLDAVSEMNFLFVLLVWCVTFFLGDYLIGKHESYLWKKKVKKLAKQLAEYQGIDPDTLDYQNITVEYDEESGIMEVIIEEKEKEGEQ